MMPNFTFLFFNLFLFVGVLFWRIGDEFVKTEMENLVQSKTIEFGPLPKKLSGHYQFAGIQKFYLPWIQSEYLSAISKKDLIHQVSLQIHPGLRKFARPHLETIFQLCEDYQVDPFWVLAIVKAESSFQVSARSPKDAQGLMQITPQTALHIFQKLHRKFDHSWSSNPQLNLELGVYYLKELLQSFHHQYDLATVAYNHGPQGVRLVIADGEGEEFLSEHQYLEKIKSNYGVLVSIPGIKKFRLGRSMAMGPTELAAFNQSKIATIEKNRSHFKPLLKSSLQPVIGPMMKTVSVTPNILKKILYSGRF